MDSVTAMKVCCGIALMVWCNLYASASHDVISYYMEDICGHTVSFSSKEANEFLFSLTRDGSSFAANMYCPVKIVADTGFQIMFKFTRVDFASSSHYLSLYSHAIGWSYGIDTYINSLLNTPVSVTPSNKGTLLFRSGSIRLSGGMSVIVTMFKQATQFTIFDSKCDDGYFHCENDRCISEDLVCNTRDNCGDVSDEWDDCSLLPWWIYFLIVFGVIFTICGITICICKLCMKKARPSVVVHQHQQISNHQTGLSFKSANTAVSLGMNAAQPTQHGPMQMGTSQVTQHGSMQMGTSQAIQHGSMQMGTSQVTQHGSMQMGTPQVLQHGSMQMGTSQATQQGSVQMGTSQATQQGSVQMGVSSQMPHNQPGMSSPYNNQQMNPHQVPPHSPVQMGVPYPAPHAPMTMPVSPPGFIPHRLSYDPPAYSSLAMDPSAPPFETIKQDKSGPLSK